MLAARPQPITVTPAAVERVKALIAGRDKPSAGVRIGIRARGCSGMSYTLEFADVKRHSGKSRTQKQSKSERSPLGGCLPKTKKSDLYRFPKRKRPGQSEKVNS